MPFQDKIKPGGAVHDDLIKRIDKLLKPLRVDPKCSLPFKILERRTIDYRLTPVTPIRKLSGKPGKNLEREVIPPAAQSESTRDSFPRYIWRFAAMIILLSVGGGLVWQQLKPSKPIQPRPGVVKVTPPPTKIKTDLVVKTEPKQVTPQPTVPPTTTPPPPNPEILAKELADLLKKDPTDAKALTGLKQFSADNVAAAKRALEAYTERVNNLYQQIKKTSFYKQGRGAKPKPWDEYRQRLDALARSGDGYARLQLATLRYRGVGMTASHQKAIESVLEFLEDKPGPDDLHAKAVSQVAMMMQNAYLSESRKLIQSVIGRFKKQAHQGIPVFQLQMARMYRKGLLGDVNEKYAQYWYKKAAVYHKDVYGKQAAKEMKVL